MSLERSFAQKINRPDLARRALRVLPVGTSTSDRDTGLASAGAAQQAVAAATTGPANTASAFLNGGSLTGGALFVLTLGLVGFYIWTRGHQA